MGDPAGEALVNIAGAAGDAEPEGKEELGPVFDAIGGEGGVETHGLELGEVFRGEIKRRIRPEPRKDGREGGIALQHLGGAGGGEVMELAGGQAGLEMLQGGAAVKEVSDVVVADDQGLAPLAGWGRGDQFASGPGRAAAERRLLRPAR